MKCIKTFFLTVFGTTISTVSMAFTPTQNHATSRESTCATTFVSKSKKGGQPTCTSSSLIYNTALKLSDGTSNLFERQFNAIQVKTYELIPTFLVLDVKKVQQDLAKNWGKIVVSGVCAMGLGTGALFAPMFATAVAYDATVLAVAFAGAVSLANVLFAEQGQKLAYGLSGALYLALAYTMAMNPALGLDVITLSIASVLAAEGVFEIAVAIKNKSLQSRLWLFASGLAAMIASIALAVNIPFTSLITPGVALGARLTSSGAAKIAIGLVGKDLADADKKIKK